MNGILLTYSHRCPLDNDKQTQYIKWFVCLVQHQLIRHPVAVIISITMKVAIVLLFTALVAMVAASADYDNR